MNIVVLSGRITKDIEVQQTANGSNYTRFSIAVDRYQKDKEKKTIFVDCVAFSHSCNFLAKYCHKGSTVTVQGELDCNVKETENGKRTYWNVIANQVEASKPTQDNGKTEEADDTSLPFEM